MGTNTLKGARSGAALAVPENATVTIDGYGTLNATVVFTAQALVLHALFMQMLVLLS